MEENQVMLEKILNELKTLEDSLDRIGKCKEETNKKYNVIEDNILRVKNEIAVIKNQKEKLLQSVNVNTSFIMSMSMVMILGFMVVLLSYILVILSSFTSIYFVVLSGLSIFLIVTLIKENGVKYLKKVQCILHQKIYDMVIDSDEYKEILLKGRILELELVKLLDEESIHKREMININSEYNSCVASILIKKSLIDYYEIELQVEPDNEKTYVRKRCNKKKI